MIIHNPDGTIGFSLFTQFPHLVCQMSTKRGTIAQDVFSMEQVHGDSIRIVDDQAEKEIAGVDGLVGSTSGRYISVRVADCVPIFFYNPTKKIYALLHAGWRGTHKGISSQMMNTLQSQDGDMNNWYAGIGPHIGACCYMVSEERAKLFADAICNNESWYLDLGKINREQLLKSGMKPDHIDSPIACTSCQSDWYYSYRREGENAERMIGIMGTKN